MQDSTKYPNAARYPNTASVPKCLVTQVEGKSLSDFADIPAFEALCQLSPTLKEAFGFGLVKSIVGWMPIEIYLYPCDLQEQIQDELGAIAIATIE